MGRKSEKLGLGLNSTTDHPSAHQHLDQALGEGRWKMMMLSK